MTAGCDHRFHNSVNGLALIPMPRSFWSHSKQAMIPAKIGTDRSPHEEKFPMARLNVNGKTYDVDVAPDTPLLWPIRENVGLTGTKFGCRIAQCGACTVHIVCEPTRSCSFLLSAAQVETITTIGGHT